MTLWFARGRRGERPHFSQNGSIANRNLADDEVVLNLDALPPGDCVISSDGASLIDIEASVEEKWHAVRAHRKELQDRWSWTVERHSPLTEACQEEWLTFLKALNRVTVDFTDPDQVTWPVEPGEEYPT